ncbi:MAG: hypothetical protein F6J98_02100 [Moorea sp. SIO4G2]|nr:hypothetical protein [Moorena sp. SIO4G2]
MRDYDYSNQTDSSIVQPGQFISTKRQTYSYKEKRMTAHGYAVFLVNGLLSTEDFNKPLFTKHFYECLTAKGHQIDARAIYLDIQTRKLGSCKKAIKAIERFLVETGQYKRGW